METLRKTELKERMQKDGKSWKAVVVNEINECGIKSKITTEFSSEDSTFEEVLHKIELDLMSNLHLGLADTIKVKIEEVEL